MCGVCILNRIENSEINSHTQSHPIIDKDIFLNHFLKSTLWKGIHTWQHRTSQKPMARDTNGHRETTTDVFPSVHNKGDVMWI